MQDPTVRNILFEQLLVEQYLAEQYLAEQYQKGQAQEVVSVLEIDAVIEPANIRKTLFLALNSIKHH